MLLIVAKLKTKSPVWLLSFKLAAVASNRHMSIALYHAYPVDVKLLRCLGIRRHA